MNVLHHDLEPIEAPSLRDLDFTAEALHQVLVDDPVGRGEEGKDVGDEVPLVIVQTVVPVMEILGQIDLLGRPEGGFGLLVHLPDLNASVRDTKGEKQREDKTTIRVTRLTS